MTPLEKARQAVVEAEEALRESDPKAAATIIQWLATSRGRASRGAYGVGKSEALAAAWRNLHLIEERELDAHRQRVLANNAKVSGQAASSAA